RPPRRASRWWRNRWRLRAARATRPNGATSWWAPFELYPKGRPSGRAVARKTAVARASRAEAKSAAHTNHFLVRRKGVAAGPSQKTTDHNRARAAARRSHDSQGAARRLIATLC